MSDSPLILTCNCNPPHDLNADETDAFVLAGHGERICLSRLSNRLQRDEPLDLIERRLLVRLVSDAIVARTIAVERESARLDAVLRAEPAGTC